MSYLKYWLGFNLVKGIGPAKLRALIDYYGDVAAAWQATESELKRIGLDSRAIASFRDTRENLDLDHCLERVENAGITLLTWDSPNYPPYLQEIPNRPPVLYLKGKLAEVDRWAVAVVGTRRLTAYGRQVTRDLVAGLVRNGVTIISGLARGIDAIAHKTALECGGRTIAVLGSGLDQIYPPENRNLVQQMVNGRGAVLSEYALGVQPEAKNFPPRNRVISGLSLGVIVIEAGKRSGALITADFALEQGRDVLAVPGNITSPASKGTNRLIQQGAKLVTHVDDVLEELNLHMVTEHQAVQLALPESPEEAAILEYLSLQPVHVDELCRATGMSASDVNSTLTMMELKGMVQKVAGMKYALMREPDPEYKTE